MLDSTGEERPGVRTPRCPAQTPNGVVRMATSDRSPLSVLIVEDMADIADSLAVFLRQNGDDVRVVGTGQDALAACGEARPDVVLLDIGLPGLTGWDVAEHLRRMRLDPAPFLVAVTGYGTPADEQTSAGAGIDLHLVKPVDPIYLLTVLDRRRKVGR